MLLIHWGLATTNIGIAAIGLPFVSANASQGYWSTQSGLHYFSIYLKGRADGVADT
ncbi:MAG: hypothetical protein ORN54_09575 [Cyclobacteriaceae bacterium]|nr:hypothetical protein [Cyclobacteriaceae bacterium]